MVRRRPPVILATDARRLSHPTDRGAFDWFVISILESPRFGADSEPPRSALCITSDAAQAHYVEVVHVARRGLGSPALRGSPRTRRSGRPLEVGEHEHVEKFGAHRACVQGRGRSGDLRDDLGLVEAHEAVLIRADLVHVDVVEPRDFEPADGLQVPLRVRAADDRVGDVVFGDELDGRLELRRCRQLLVEVAAERPGGTASRPFGGRPTHRWPAPAHRHLSDRGVPAQNPVRSEWRRFPFRRRSQRCGSRWS